MKLFVFLIFHLIFARKIIKMTTNFLNFILLLVVELLVNNQG